MDGSQEEHGRTARAREAAYSAARQEAARLTARDIHGVALTWVDNAGLTRVKAVPTARLPQAALRGVGMSPVFDVYRSDDSHNGAPDGDLRLFPDLGRLTVLAAQPGWAWAPVDRFEQDGTPYAGCQRLFAARMAERAREYGLELRMGFETEWFVTYADGAPLPAPSAPAGGPGAVRFAGTGPAYGMARVVETSGYLRDVLRALAEQDVEVLQVHPEYAPGQFEVSVAPDGPVGAADLAVLVRETLRAVSARHRLNASFAPVHTLGTTGNGAHLHLSLHGEGGTLCRGGPGPYGMTRTCEAFLAGVLDHLPSLLALTAPLPVSYHRLVPHNWAGAYQCWGAENREAALRFVPGPPGDADAANAELKCIDPAANPYLAVGSVIACGLHGIDSGATLPPPVAGDPSHRPDIKRLPAALPDALEHFTHSALMRSVLGDPLFQALVAVREGEIALARGRSPQELVDATVDRY
ncbi:glutamine synthetase [Streptomyces gamaensis]|uniref:Glutamine synthetase n=1 Tax=Streptomyces gamaensis TaxID=1763542 RepID=A0ABW0Z608_9ACTN